MVDTSVIAVFLCLEVLMLFEIFECYLFVVVVDEDINKMQLFLAEWQVQSCWAVEQKLTLLLVK